MKTAKDYYTGHRAEFEPFTSRGYLSLDVLPFLIGKPWDDVALAYVHSLRPSCIRVSNCGGTCDAVCWRVSVALDRKTKLITGIQQEVEVGLPEGVAHGRALRDALKHGIKSKQVKWHVDCTDVMVVSDEAASFFGMKQGGMYKTTKGGKTVRYPKS